MTRSALSKRYIAIAIVMLLLGIVAGYFFPMVFSHQLAPSLKELTTIAARTKEAHSWWLTFGTIFLHNTAAMVAMMIFGSVLCVYPMFILWTNGLVVGYLAITIYQTRGILPWKMFVYGILPHGIFELSAFIWAAAIGIANGIAVIRYFGWQFSRHLQDSEMTSGLLTTRESGASIYLRPLVGRSLRSLPYIIILLLIAALVETSVTPLLIAHVMNKT